MTSRLGEFQLNVLSEISKKGYITYDRILEIYKNKTNANNGVMQMINNNLIKIKENQQNKNKYVFAEEGIKYFE